MLLTAEQYYLPDLTEANKYSLRELF
jgi:hypothetical protein